MEAAIQTLVKVFLKSTKGKDSLGKKEFQSLVKSQLSNILSDTESKEAVNNMGQGLDENHDGKVGFEEYMKLVGYLAVSLSEQRALSKEEPAENAASGQVAQSIPDKEEEKPAANLEAKAEAKPEASEEAKAEAKPKASEEAKAEAVASGSSLERGITFEGKVEVKAEGELQPEAAKEEPTAAGVAGAAAAGVAAAAGMATAAVEAAAPAVEVVVKEEEKVEEAAEKLVAAVVEEAEKKTEEAAS